MKKFLYKYGGIESEEFDKVHITSDLHFRHANVLNFEPIREELRKAANFEGDADEFLIHTWNSQVAEDDLVVNLGDLHWKSLEPIADRLNGTMLLVLGNHDSKAPYYDKFPNVYVCSGVWNLDGIPKEYYINSRDKLLSGFILDEVFYCHYPLYNIEHEYNYQRHSNIISRMEILKEIMDVEGIKYNVHGHLHSKDDGKTANSLNVCIDFNKYKILDFKETHNKVKES